MKLDQRLIASQLLYQVVVSKNSLGQVLSQSLSQDIDSQQRKFIMEIVFGVLRQYYQLDAICNVLLTKPMKSKDSIAKCFLLVGMYQLLFMRTPEYAAISATVNAAKRLKQPWAPGLINKCLRRLDSEKESILQQCESTDAISYNHPDWLIDKLKTAWPENWQDILTHNNQIPPMFLRTNLQQTKRDDLLSALTTQQIDASNVAQNSTAIRLPKPISIIDLAEFKHGFCSVQDLAGQFVIDLLDLKPEQTVLDACAAPGSKTCHILEAEPKLKKLVSLDNDPERMLKIKENLTRLKLSHQHLQLVLADATHAKQWWDGVAFDRILIDAPCSASGVIRRHPDIKLLRKASDLTQLTQTQLLILESLWPLLKKSGKLIYTTCSILPEENQHLIKKFLQKHQDAKESDANCYPLHKDMLITQPGRQLLPGNSLNTDGFFYMVIEKY